MKATPKMIAAGAEAARKYLEETVGNNPAVIWDAMWAAQPAPVQQEPIGKAHLCDRCSTPFDGEDECPECGHGSATKKQVYAAPQPAQPQDRVRELECVIADLKAECQALRAEQPAQQEPVAWQFFHSGRWHNGMAFNDHRKQTEAAGVPVRDLYPSPQPPAQPLTDKQISKIAEEFWLYPRKFVRAIEAAHGITKGENT